jgi:uncharacterized protein (TIGR03083 family)
MADESLLDDFDPFDLLDREADRVHRHFLSLPDWSCPSRCEGWSTRDVLGHVMGLEDYTRAGLDDRVEELFRAAPVDGALDVAAFNDWQTSAYAELPRGELVSRWRATQVENRTELRRRRRNGTVDTSIGQYSSWLQTWHYAVEYATHGDDIFVAVADDERADRTAWRVRFGRFVLQEQDKPVQVEEGDTVVVTSDLETFELSPEDFVEATQGRLPQTHPLTPQRRSLLRTI